MMKKHWFKKLRLLFRMKSLVKSIRDYVNSMAREELESAHYAENRRKIIEKIITLVEVCLKFVSSNGTPSTLENYENFAPEDVDLSLAELLVLFRRTLGQLQAMNPEVQQNALEILYSYFIELQGLYDLIFISKYENEASLVPLSPSSIEDHYKRYVRLPDDVLRDPLLQEYQSIQYKGLMKVSSTHHLHVILFDLLPQFLVTGLKERLRRKPRCKGMIDPKIVNSVDELRALLLQNPLTETAKLSVALHRHTMRIFDIFGTHIILRWGRPVFDLLVIATWSQTVKDHIVPGQHNSHWQAEHLDMEREVSDTLGGPGRIKMSSAFFMQPRIKFGFERFLIFKSRTMTVGDIVRTHELGNWMRKNSPDEFLQFFNIALGDMGGLGIRTMPEHEISETKDTMWLYAALMSFVPGGMTSPGSILMRKSNYEMTKVQQLFQEIRFYDPRFQGSSSFLTDIKIMIRSLLVLQKGRVGSSLEKTESFTGKQRGY